MWKYGGVYSDLDTITVKSFESLIKNKSGFGCLDEGYKSLGSGVIVFSRPKHPFLYYVMKMFTKNYHPYEWSKNGPKLLKQSLNEYCEIDDFLDLAHVNSSSKCSDLIIYPENYFYPFTFARDELSSMFVNNFPNISEYRTRVENGTYSIHFYGHLSSKFEAHIGDNSFYIQMAYENCRRTFNYVKENNFVFY